jgi:copper chaperone CopZ
MARHRATDGTEAEEGDASHGFRIWWARKFVGGGRRVNGPDGVASRTFAGDYISRTSMPPRETMPDRRSRTIARLTIGGLTSVHAVRAVFTALAGVQGVVHADVNRHGAVVEHDGTVAEAALRDAVSLAGFALSGIVEERRVLPIV